MEKNSNYSSCFGGAFSALKDGLCVCRFNWQGKKWLMLQIPDANSKMTKPYIYMVNGNSVVPYTPTQQDIFSNDWMIWSEV